MQSAVASVTSPPRQKQATEHVSWSESRDITSLVCSNWAKTVGQCTRYELEIGPQDDRILRFFYGDICIFVLKDVPAAIAAVDSHRAAPGKDKEFGIGAEGGLEFLAVVGIIRLQFSRREGEGSGGTGKNDGPITRRKRARNSNDTLAYL